VYLRYLKILLGTALFPVIFLILANYLIDPYEIFQTRLFDEVGATQERYLKIEHLKNDKSFDTFLLGGSRMGTTNPVDLEKIIPNAHVYNFFVSSGNQTDNLANGRWLMKSQPQIKTLYVQVDWPESLGFFYNSHQHLPHPDVEGKSRTGFVEQYLFLFSFKAFGFKIANNTSKKGEFKLPLSSGHFYYPKRDAFLQKNCKDYVSQTPSLTNPVDEELATTEQSSLISKSLSTLKQLVAEANDRGVKVVLYVTPHHHRFLDKINLNLYADFLEQLAAISTFWNFGFYSDITLNDCNYYESSHYVREVAPKLYRAMIEGDIGSFAHRVSADSVSSEVAWIKTNFAEHRSNNKRKK
jgi:hypothetical protein